MQSQSQPPFGKNVSWAYNRNSIEKKEEHMESFDDIESMTIERIYKSYVDSKGDILFQIVVLGKYSVDLKDRIKFSSSDPDNPKKQHLVIRGHSHQRRRAGLLK